MQHTWFKKRKPARWHWPEFLLALLLVPGFTCYAQPHQLLLWCHRGFVILEHTVFIQGAACIYVPCHQAVCIFFFTNKTYRKQRCHPFLFTIFISGQRIANFEEEKFLDEFVSPCALNCKFVRQSGKWISFCGLWLSVPYMQGKYVLWDASDALIISWRFRRDDLVLPRWICLWNLRRNSLPELGGGYLHKEKYMHIFILFNSLLSWALGLLLLICKCNHHAS